MRDSGKTSLGGYNPTAFNGVIGTTEEAAEKLRDLSHFEENHPSAAKAGGVPLDLSARINPCPFKAASDLSFSATCEVVPS
jgi:hypothetical protein